MSDPSRGIDVIPLHAWLIDAGLSGVPIEALFDRFCERLVAADFPLVRGFLSVSTLHPQRRADSLTWHSGRSVDASEFRYD